MSKIYNYLHSFFYRSKDAVRGSGIYSLLRRIKSEQRLPLNELRELQNERLRELLKRAGEHSPYYRDLFKSANIIINDRFGIENLRELPLLSREKLQNNYKSIICDNAGQVFSNSSGGSTGAPVNFYHDENYRRFAETASLLFLDWMGINSGDRTAVVWGADRDFKDLSRRDRFFIRFDRVKALNAFSMSDEKIGRFISDINRFRPLYVYGYASALYLVARQINMSEPLKFKPKAVRSAAEMLYDFQRREIEKAFGSAVYNFYGSREINNLAAECSAHSGLHIVSSGRIVEIVDEAGNPVPDGESGQIAVTDLTNLSFPFIRYLNGDMGVMSTKPCSCGRTFPLIEKIQGRTSDVIIVDGRYIHGEYFTHLFYHKPEIVRFQLIQEEAKKLKLLIVSKEKDPDLNEVISAIRSKVGDGVAIEIEFTDHIPVTASGKFRFTVSRLDQSSKEKV